LRKQLCSEHGVDARGNFNGTDEDQMYIGSFFDETISGRYQPRAIYADTKHTAVPFYKHNTFKNYFQLLQRALEPTVSTECLAAEAEKFDF